MSTSPSDINQALLEVRKGFRLLHNYQRLALDAVNHIGTQLGFRYAGGWARFSSNTPKAGKGALDDWAWDWLNMMWHEFYFEPEGVEPAPFYLSIWLVSDTGYFASVDPAAENLCGYHANLLTSKRSIAVQIQASAEATVFS